MTKCDVILLIVTKDVFAPDYKVEKLHNKIIGVLYENCYNL